MTLCVTRIWLERKRSQETRVSFTARLRAGIESSPAGSFRSIGAREDYRNRQGRNRLRCVVSQARQQLSAVSEIALNGPLGKLRALGHPANDGRVSVRARVGQPFG
jgi:hypothetical protein